MKSIWPYIGVLMFGIVIGFVIAIQLLKNEINNQEINIKRPKMKNNKDSLQEFTSNISEKKGLFKRLKRKKHGKS